MGNLSGYFFIKQGARQPVFTTDEYQSDGVTPVDLRLATGATFRMRSETGTTLVISSAMTMSGTYNNHFEYDWTATDTLVPGRYIAEAEVDFVNSSPLVVPLLGYWHIIIVPTLP